MDEANIADIAAAPGRREANRARGAALRLLALRPRSVAGMREKLERRFGAELADMTVSHLEAEGLLNDEHFAQQWCDSRDRRSPRSSKLIKRELKQRGVPEEAIETALQDFDSGEAARRAGARYAAKQIGCDRVTFDRRVGAFLDRRGFDLSVIRETLREFRTELAIAYGATGSDPDA